MNDPQLFTHRQHLHASLFDRTGVADIWLDQIEEQLVLAAWRAGWLPTQTTWDMWVEVMEYSQEPIPVVEVSMRVERRRRRLAPGLGVSLR